MVNILGYAELIARACVATEFCLCSKRAALDNTQKSGEGGIWPLWAKTVVYPK